MHIFSQFTAIIPVMRSWGQNIFLALFDKGSDGKLDELFSWTIQTIQNAVYKQSFSPSDKDK